FSVGAGLFHVAGDGLLADLLFALAQLGLLGEDVADAFAGLVVFGAYLGGGGALQQQPDSSVGQAFGGCPFGLAALVQFVAQLNLALVDGAHLRDGLAGRGAAPVAGVDQAERLPRGRRRFLPLLAVLEDGVVLCLCTAAIVFGLLVVVGFDRTVRVCE